ncbi:MAG TPA: hypothetical protein IAB46_11415 [Candidatus Scybalocola faecigallinarum]|uniref:SGNH/GDSL hydrolase family protein n=1 Tax=Candidatus Scybalocola faecigallinarum TaxID=2840941 RepID=A0A9D1JRC9_9FIRM|nr:hypothetical protein [Candidatus Scybalocola faecigallinarum]
MKNGIKKAVASIVFMLGLVCLLVILSYIFLPKNNMKAFGMEDVTANGILGEKENSIDVLVLGDSESYSSITPMQIWEEQGFTTYVCGTPGQYLYQSDSYLQQAFINQKPKVVILETNAIYRKMSFNASILNRIENVFAVFKYHNRWKSMQLGDLTSSADYTWTDDFKGYQYYNTVDGTANSDYMAPTDKSKLIHGLNWQYVSDMADFCEKNGAQFILVSTPSTVNWNYERHNGIVQLANALDIPYVDMNLMKNEITIDWTKDTRDKGDHLNHSGAVKVSRWLGNYLKKAYNLPDHRQDDGYSKWNEALTRYKKGVGEA